MRRHGAAPLPTVSRSSSAPTLPLQAWGSSGGPPASCSKNWTSETKRYLHQRRERRWLRNKAKHHCLDFSDSERAELKLHFSALAESDDRISIAKLENMLISLGLAKTRREVSAIVAKIERIAPEKGLDFDEYLEIVRTRTDGIEVFKAMMQGKLGDPSLNFQTVLSQYRRQLIINATGSREGVQVEEQEFGKNILHNFASLKNSYHLEAVADLSSDAGQEANEEEQPSSAPLNTSLASSASDSAIAFSMPFDATIDQAPYGGLKMVWRGVCHENRLVSSRPTSANGGARRTVEKPLSPRTIVQSIVKVKGKEAPPSALSSRFGKSRKTIIINAHEEG